MAMESGGRRQFVFPLTAAKKYGIKRASFWRHVQELVDANFIIRHSMANLRQANEYEFSLLWKGQGPI